MSLLFNMLSRFVIAYLHRSKCLLTSWLQSTSTVILETKKTKSVTVSIFSPLFGTEWWDQMPWSSFFECWVFSPLCHSSLSSRDTLVPVSFPPLGWCHMTIWGYWHFSWHEWWKRGNLKMSWDKWQIDFLSGWYVHWCNGVLMTAGITVFLSISSYLLRCSCIGCLYVNEYNILFLYWSCYQYTVSFFIFLYGLCFKVYFVW